MTTKNNTARVQAVIEESEQTYEQLTQSPTKKYDDLGTTSAKIRAMYADGFKTAVIAKTLGIRYQHARNVITAPVKKVATA